MFQFLEEVSITKHFYVQLLMYQWLLICISDQPVNKSLGRTRISSQNNLHLCQLLTMLETQHWNTIVFAFYECPKLKLKKNTYLATIFFSIKRNQALRHVHASWRAGIIFWKWNNCTQSASIYLLYPVP